MTSRRTLLIQSHRSDSNREPMLCESDDREVLPVDHSMAGVEVAARDVSPSGVTGSNLASRIGEVGDAKTIGTGSERGNIAAKLPTWLADAVRRWREWPEWKRAAVRALVDADVSV